MILVCPSCTTRYKIDAASLGEGGRQVKCARCGHVWHAEPVLEPEPVRQIDTRAAEIFGAPRDPIPEPEPEPAPDLDDAFSPLGASAGLSAGKEVTDHISVPRKSEPNKLGWTLFAVAVLAVGAGGFFARDQLVTAWPPAAKLYDTLGIAYDDTGVLSKIAGEGLTFADIESEWGEKNGVPVLTVRGTVANESDATRPVPPLVVWLATEDNRQLQSWELTVDAEKLEPGETVKFETSIDSPADGAERVEIAVLES
ncbi:MAG: MJ0042-type zinc finger domain-containing protein [Pseudomonadota bacterium]